MRQIKASEVKPGMEVRWEQGGITYECAISSVGPASFGVNVMAQQSVATIYNETPVTVLAEPAPAQPEEPTEFGARVVVDGTRFIRRGGDTTYAWEASFGICFTWDDLLCLGKVTVVSDQGWTVPDDAPEVLVRIEEWPEDDTALRPYKWREHCGYTWKWITAASEWECYDEVGNYVASGWRPSCGPLTRVSDA